MTQHFVEHAKDLNGIVGIAKDYDQINVTGGTKAQPIVFPGWRGYNSPRIHVQGGYVVVKGRGRVRLNAGELVASDSQVEALGGRAELRDCSGAVGGSNAVTVIAHMCHLRAERRARVEVQDDPEAGADIKPSQIIAADESTVVLRGRSRCEASDSASIEAFDDAIVKTTHGFRGTVVLHDRSRLEEHSGATFQRFRVQAFDEARIQLGLAPDGLALELSGRAQATIAKGRALVLLRGESFLSCGAGAKVRAYDRARCTAKGTGTVVELYDAATCDPDWDVQLRDLRPQAAAPTSGEG